MANLRSAGERTPTAFLFGTRLGKYEIGPRLGVGSMGAVYRGMRRSDGRSVAIKVLDAELAEKPIARARFKREGKLTARVRHPNIVEIIDAGEELEWVYLVMELLEGEDLGRRLERSGPIPIVEAVDILVRVCDAIATAHRRGIIHRDLKPSNIFLAVKDGRAQPIVLDFGIARAEDESDAGDRAIDGARVAFGTPMYLAPELIADHQVAGPLSDQYALGIILYEALTGDHPHAADDMEHLFDAITSGHPLSPRARRSDIPFELDGIVQRATNPNPQARFPSVADLGLALRPLVSASGERARLGRRRHPSSPAIDAEAATPSPFVRTLIPELPAKSDPSFFAPDSQDESPDEKARSSLPPDLEEGGKVSPSLRLVGFRKDALPAIWRIDRRWARGIVIASAVALSGLAPVFMLHGRRSTPARLSSVSTKIELPAVRPSTPSVNGESAAAEPGAAELVPSVPSLLPRATPAVRAREAPPPSQPAAVRSVIDSLLREEILSPRPHRREGTEVRMHNGVPLLD